LQLTLKRTWAALSIFEKLKFMWMILQSLDSKELTKEAIEDLKNPEVLEELVRELTKEIPSAVTPLVTERDMFLSSSLKQCAQMGPVVVGVVGLGHIQGIKEYWEKQVNREALLVAPPSSRKELVVFVGASVSLVTAGTYLAFRLVKFAITALRQRL